MSSHLRLNIRSWQITTLLVSSLCAIIFIKIPNNISGLSPIFQNLFFQQDSLASLPALIVSLLAMVCVDRGDTMQAKFRSLARHPHWLAGAVLAVTAVGAWYVYHNHALSMDEYAPLLQSQIFATGHLSGTLSPELLNGLVPLSFQGVFINVSHETGAIASAYWPSWALALTPFSFLGVPWLCNPVISALTILALAKLLEALIDDPAARGFALLACAASPVILINGMSYYGMPLQLLCSLMFTLCFIRGSTGQLLAAGVWAALSMTAVNPVPFALYALPWLIWLIANAIQPWRKLALLALGALPITLLFGIGWKVFLLNNVHDSQTTQLGANISGMLGLFRLPTLELLLARGMALVKLNLWAVPGLLLLAGLAYQEKQKHVWIGIFSASALTTLVGYIFVPFDQGHGWGYRYFHTAWLVLPVLAAAALQAMTADPAQKQRAYGFAFALCLGTLALTLPLRLVQVESFISAQLQQIPSRLAGDDRQMVFVKMHCGYYTADLVQNAPFMGSKEIHLVSQSDALDLTAARMLGAKPQLVSKGLCGDRWRLD